MVCMAGNITSNFSKNSHWIICGFWLTVHWEEIQGLELRLTIHQGKCTFDVLVWCLFPSVEEKVPSLFVQKVKQVPRGLLSGEIHHQVSMKTCCFQIICICMTTWTWVSDVTIILVMRQIVVAHWTVSIDTCSTSGTLKNSVWSYPPTQTPTNPAN